LKVSEIVLAVQLRREGHRQLSVNAGSCRLVASSFRLVERTLRLMKARDPKTAGLPARKALRSREPNMKVSLSILAAGTLLALASLPARAADFDCGAAQTDAEKAICSSDFLSHLDDRTARLYGWLWASLEEGPRQHLRDEQRLFLAFRDACGPDKSCLQKSYVTRIEDLSTRLRQVMRVRQVS
jgi:uncharacterized protein YecT (DUF1311 family)